MANLKKRVIMVVLALSILLIMSGTVSALGYVEHYGYDVYTRDNYTFVSFIPAGYTLELYVSNGVTIQSDSTVSIISGTVIGGETRGYTRYYELWLSGEKQYTSNVFTDTMSLLWNSDIRRDDEHTNHGNTTGYNKLSVAEGNPPMAFMVANAYVDRITLLTDAQFDPMEITEPIPMPIIVIAPEEQTAAASAELLKFEVTSSWVEEKGVYIEHILPNGEIWNLGAIFYDDLVLDTEYTYETAGTEIGNHKITFMPLNDNYTADLEDTENHFIYNYVVTPGSGWTFNSEVKFVRYFESNAESSKDYRAYVSIKVEDLATGKAVPGQLYVQSTSTYNEVELINEKEYKYPLGWGTHLLNWLFGQPISAYHTYEKQVQCDTTAEHLISDDVLLRVRFYPEGYDFYFEDNYKYEATYDTQGTPDKYVGETHEKDPAVPGDSVKTDDAVTIVTPDIAYSLLHFLSAVVTLLGAIGSRITVLMNVVFGLYTVPIEHSIIDSNMSAMIIGFRTFEIGGFNIWNTISGMFAAMMSFILIKLFRKAVAF